MLVGILLPPTFPRTIVNSASYHRGVFAKEVHSPTLGDLCCGMDARMVDRCCSILSSRVESLISKSSMRARRSSEVGSREGSVVMSALRCGGGEEITVTKARSSFDNNTEWNRDNSKARAGEI